MEERFLKLLPRIKTHGSIAFRHIKCKESRDESIAELSVFRVGSNQRRAWFLPDYDAGPFYAALR